MCTRKTTLQWPLIRKSFFDNVIYHLQTRCLLSNLIPSASDMFQLPDLLFPGPLSSCIVRRVSMTIKIHHNHRPRQWSIRKLHVNPRQPLET